MILLKKNTYAMLLLSYLFISGCISVPNYKRTDINSPLSVPANKFKYGKFCGAGHPTFDSQPGSRQRTDDLMRTWPPVDDVDLLCYAHDLCYQVAGSQNLICDQALSATVIANATSFNELSGCRNLVMLIGEGLGAKVTGTEKSKGGSTVITVANALWTLPVSLVSYTMNSSNVNKYGYPATEGKCFENSNHNIHPYQLISDFEANFREYAKGYETYSFSKAGKKDISIPVPIKNWKDKYLIFETQKYLNYFGYNAGKTDGILNNRTTRAILQFSEAHKIKWDDLSYVNQTLKQLFLSESFSDRMRVLHLTPQQKAKLFGYTY